MNADDDRYGQAGPGLLDVTPAPAKPVRRTSSRAAKAPADGPADGPAKPARTRAKTTPARPSASADQVPATTPPKTTRRSAAKPAAVAPTTAVADEETPAPLALYRRYRPDTFDDVIGQDHVTEPLKRALANNKVNHAYLFSGPRGCGKTSSARILARCLNCEQGPTATPCGVCQSCRDLATGGPGSIDVIEMDAASHGLVDDARDLRERAFFVPVQSRFKVYIIDEAHMVTTQGFNALLKLVEEPPPHVKFIFATTEPDKVIGTIRSRTHHYPFRLVPPKIMQAFLQKVCDQEGVAVQPGVLPLVVRAGAGSVRDSLSVLDQLLGSSGPGGVAYDNAAALLGYTPDALLDATVDAFAAGDGAAVYATIDKVIETGQDPQRFGTDLLQRLRDVLVASLVPDALTSGLIDLPGDQAARLQAQATAMGQDRATQAAEVIAKGLTSMRGTTAPRLHLELMCAQVLAPQEDTAELARRIDRLERRLVGTPTPSPAPSPAEPAHQPAAPQRPRFRDTRPTQPGQPTTATIGDGPRSSAEPARQRPATADQAPPHPTAQSRPAESRGASPGYGLAQLRQAWPTVLDNVKQMRRLTWILLSQNCELVDIQGDVLTIGFSNAGARDSYLNGNSPQILVDALMAVTNARWRVTPILTGPGSQTHQGAPSRDQPAPAAGVSAPAISTPAAVATPTAAVTAPTAAAATPAVAVSRSTGVPRGPVSSAVYAEDDSTTPFDDASPNDADVDDDLDAASLLSAELGAELIEDDDV